MNTIDELVTRGVKRVQHDSWNEGEYLCLRIVQRDDGLRRPAPNATQYAKERKPEEVPVYTLVGNGEAEWRAYVGPRHRTDLSE